MKPAQKRALALFLSLPFLALFAFAQAPSPTQASSDFTTAELNVTPSPAAEASVRATQCRASGRSAAQSLDGRWSGGYFHPSDEDLSPETPVFPTTDARPCVFSTFTRSNRRVYLEQHQNTRFSS